MKKKIVCCSIGMDIGKSSIHICVKYQDDLTAVSIKSTRKFSNAPKGWEALSKHLNKFLLPDLPYIIILEATGVYYENIAYFLNDLDYEVCVILPKQSSYFAKTINQKSKNDDMDSKMLAQMGIEKFGSLKRWNAPSECMRKLRQLVRYRLQLMKHGAQFKNQLHAVNHSHKPSQSVLLGLEQQISFIEAQIQELEKEIEQNVQMDPTLNQGIQNICTIKGFGLMSAATIVAETYGFELFKSIPQLVSYAGYDVVQNQSGNRNGKTKISKKGNAKIRAAMHFPALVAVQTNEEHSIFFNRIFDRNPKIKMIGYVAVQRKLLVLAYSLYKNKTSYDPNYAKRKKEVMNETLV